MNAAPLPGRASAGRRTALLLIDLQNDFCHADGAFSRHGLRVDGMDELLDNVKDLLGQARRYEVPVVWAAMVYDSVSDAGLLAVRGPRLAGTHLRRGTWGAELLDGLDVRPEDLMVEKKRFSAFFGTDLDRWLADAGIRRLVIGGVRTEMCVETTVRDAFMRDIEVVLAAEATGGPVRRSHENSLLVLDGIFAEVASPQRASAALAADGVPA